MNYHTTGRYTPTADLLTVPSELTLRDCWDADAVSQLIISKTDRGVGPAFLFLGRKEAAMLKEHLAQVFGEESVSNINGTYYKGLEVLTVDCERFLATAGRKATRTLQDPISRRPSWRDKDFDAMWQFRL